MLKVGSIEKKDGEITICRQYFGQGYIFKDEDAYLNRKSEPCYVPELSDCIYTANDLTEICMGQMDFADKLFYAVDWQHPETYFNEMMNYGEWQICKGCHRLIDCGDTGDITECPFCGNTLD